MTIGEFFWPQNKKHRLFITLIHVTVVIGLLGVLFAFQKKFYDSKESQALETTFSYLGTHPGAAVQPTTVGQRITTLKGFNNKLYAGYGDYGANSGPIAVTPFDLSTNAFAATPELVQNTQMIGLYRTINNKLYSPSIDIRTSNYAVADFTNGTAAWKEFSWRDSTQKVPFMIHVFDMNTSNGTDLWMAGSSNQDATLFRSTDGGATWTEMQRIVGNATTYHRYYGVVALNDKVYVQPFSVSSGVVAPAGNSRMYSNGTWSNGPKLTTGYNVWHPEQFAGKAVYFNWASVDSMSPSCLNVFNGSSVSTSCPSGGISDYAIDGDTLYAINSGKVYSTKDLNSWYLQGSGPLNAVSITVMNGKIYVGTTDSKLYSAPVNSAPSPVSGSGGTTAPCKGKGCNGGGGGGPSTCNGKKCQTADGARAE